MTGYIAPICVLRIRMGALDSAGMVRTMMTMRWVRLGVCGLLAVGTMAWGQATGAGAANASGASADAAVYVDDNSKEPMPLKLDGLEGSVRGLGGDALPRATVSLFAEDGHALVGTVVTDKEGKFRFKVDKGFYRVVARVEGLCPANVPVKVERSMLAKHKLVITMVAKDIDTCSYGTAK
jgi:hypothetical protein